MYIIVSSDCMYIIWMKSIYLLNNSYSNILLVRGKFFFNDPIIEIEFNSNKY